MEHQVLVPGVHHGSVASTVPNLTFTLLNIKISCMIKFYSLSVITRNISVTLLLLKCSYYASNFFLIVVILYTFLHTPKYNNFRWLKQWVIHFYVPNELRHLSRYINNSALTQMILFFIQNCPAVFK